MPGEARCRKIYKDAGISAPDRANEAGQQTRCDQLYFLKSALERSGQPNADGLRAGAEALGSTHTPAGTFATRFGPGRHYGAAALSDFVFDGKCECFKYVRKPFAIV
jgi:hypothetical protein